MLSIFILWYWLDNEKSMIGLFMTRELAEREQSVYEYLTRNGPKQIFTIEAHQVVTQ